MHPSIAALALFVLLAPLFLLLGGMCALIYFVNARKPRNNPQAFLQRGKRAVSSVVVCAGDSLTHASLSADYVLRLRHGISSYAYEIVNAGLNGNESADLLRRIPEIVRCKPDAISVLIGSNDVRTRFPHEAELAFQTNLNAIMGELRKKTEARIALLSIPPLGEDIAGEANRDVDRCNTVIRRVAAENAADYLPLHESLKLLIEKSGIRPPLPFRLRLRLLLGAAIQHYVLRRSWDDISARNAFVVHTDQLHLNDRAAAVTADLIANWLNSPPVPTEGVSTNCPSSSQEIRRRNRSGLGALCSGGLEWTGHSW
jgi:acyl-CoA thioesterase I